MQKPPLARGLLLLLGPFSTGAVGVPVPRAGTKLGFHRCPGGSSRRALLTQETTPPEPGVLDQKLYVRGVGTVREDTIKGGVERFVLQSIRDR